MSKKNVLPAKQMHIGLTKAIEGIQSPVAKCILDAGPSYWLMRATEALSTGEVELSLVLIALLQKAKLDGQAIRAAAEGGRGNSESNRKIPDPP